MPKRSKTESAKSKVESATALATVGGAIGGPVGAGIGALTGLIIGDRNLVFPLDMVAIPAYQAYMITDSPALQVYIRAGETLAPTGGNVEDVQSALDDAEADRRNFPMKKGADKKPKASAYQRRYKREFNKIANRFKKANGEWKKDGFRKAVKEAHKMARK